MLKEPSSNSSPSYHKNDRDEIDTLTTAFFKLFTNTNGQKPQVNRIKDFFIPSGMIISNTTGTPEIYTLESFIAPREVMLTDGTLTDFNEGEISHTTELYGNVAHRFCLYQKSGKLNGVEFKAKGMKTLQFVKVNGAWKMSSVAWSDEEV